MVNIFDKRWHASFVIAFQAFDLPRVPSQRNESTHDVIALMVGKCFFTLQLRPLSRLSGNFCSIWEITLQTLLNARRLDELWAFRGENWKSYMIAFKWSKHISSTLISRKSDRCGLESIKPKGRRKEMDFFPPLEVHFSFKRFLMSDINLAGWLGRTLSLLLFVELFGWKIVQWAFRVRVVRAATSWQPRMNQEEILIAHIAGMKVSCSLFFSFGITVS
jgi:hypothetical protein